MDNAAEAYFKFGRPARGGELKKKGSNKNARPGTGKQPREGEKKIKVGRAGRRRWIIIKQEARGFTYSPGQRPEKVPVDEGVYPFLEVPMPMGGDMKVFKLERPEGDVYVNPVYLEKMHLEFEISDRDPMAKAA